MIVYSLLTAVIVVQQQDLWGAYFLRPGPQKPQLPRGLGQERAAVAAVFQITLLRIATNCCSAVAAC